MGMTIPALMLMYGKEASNRKQEIAHTVQLARELFARCGVQGDVLEKQRPSGVLYEFNIRDSKPILSPKGFEAITKAHWKMS